jgi:hypothetical protein
MWLILTLAATVIVWEAVSVVAADVTDRPAPVVAQHEVAVALKNGSSTTILAPLTPPNTAATVSLPPTSRGVTPTTAPRTVTTPITASAAPPTTAAPVTTTTTTSPPRPAATPPTTAVPTGARATYSTGGGVVTVACTGVSSIELVAAVPFDGYQALVFSGGPNFVALSFVNGSGGNFPVGASCAFGQPFQFQYSGSHPGP